MAVSSSGSLKSGRHRAVAMAAILTFLFLSIVSASAQNIPAATEIATYNRQLRSEITRAGVIRLLELRRRAVTRVIKDAPGSVRGLMLSLEERQRLLAIAPGGSPLIEREGTWSGPLELLAEDDFQHNRSITHWRLRTSSGPSELFFAHGAPAIKPACSPRLTVAGVGNGSAIAVDSVVAHTSSPPVCSTEGVQHIAVIMLTMPSSQTFPSGFDAGYFQQLFFGNSGYTLNTYWDASSYGQASATGQVFGPFALNADYNCTDSDNLATAAIQAASSVDFTQFDRVALIFPVQTCSYGGLGTIGCWETIVPNQDISISWLPVFPYQQTYNYVGTVAHEFGHNLGLNHSNTVDYGSLPLGAMDDDGSNLEYGDPFSVMGQVWTVDGAQKIFGQYDAPHKALDLNWLKLSDGSYEEVTAAGSFTMLPFEASSGLRALRVLRDPASGGWLWLEYRQPIDVVDGTFSFLTDLNEPTKIFDGALGHFESSLLDPLHTYLVDFNAVSQPNDFYHAPLTSGQSWSDPYSALTVEVHSADSDGLRATITYDQPCASLSLSGSPFTAAGGSGSVAVTAPSSCNWDAKTSTSWITLTGQTSGSGNGSVNFTVSASPGGIQQRNGFIAVQRQSLAVVEAGSGAAVVSATPVMGSGTDANPTFSFFDANGQGSISSASINISSLANPNVNGCSMFVSRAAGTVSLLNDSGTQYLSPLNLASSGSVSNSQCKVLASGSSMSGAGTNFHITLHLQFKDAYAGAHNVTASVTDANVGPSNPIQVATWIVPLSGMGSASVLLDPGTLDFGNRPVGSPSTDSAITVRNSGDGLLLVSGISLSGADAADFAQHNNCGSTLAANATCTVQVSFTPSGTGAKSARLLVSDSASGSPHSVSLSGSGGSNPVASVTPGNLIFASQQVGTNSDVSNLTYSNVGGGTLNIGSISLGGNNASEFSETNNCGASLAVGASCNIALTFVPTVAGSRLATLTIVDDASDSPHTVGLSGTGSDFDLGGTQQSLSAAISAGQTATYNLQLTSENGFTGAVTLSCTDNIPYSTCKISQSGPISLNGNSVPVTIQVTTTGPTAGAAGTLADWSFPSGLFLTLGALAIAGLVPGGKQWRAGFATAIFLACFSLVSCGGGSSSGGSSAPPQITPNGTYQATVNATSNGVTHTVKLMLKVQ